MIKRERLDDTPMPKKEGRKLFQKGEARPEGSGRKPGQKNKHGRLLKECLIIAAEMEGSDGQGKDGLVGALRRCYREEKREFMKLMGKLLPLQITGQDGSPMQIEHSTKDQILERFKERGMPLPPSLLEMPSHGEGNGEKPN